MCQYDLAWLIFDKCESQVKERLDTMFADMEMHDFEDAEDEDEEEEEETQEEEEEEAEDGGYVEDNDPSEVDGREHAVESFDDVSPLQNSEDEHVAVDELR